MHEALQPRVARLFGAMVQIGNIGTRRRNVTPEEEEPPFEEREVEIGAAPDKEAASDK